MKSFPNAAGGGGNSLEFENLETEVFPKIKSIFDFLTPHDPICPENHLGDVGTKVKSYSTFPHDSK